MATPWCEEKSITELHDGFYKIEDGSYIERSGYRKIDQNLWVGQMRFVSEEEYRKLTDVVHQDDQSNTQVIMSAQADTFDTLVRDMNTLMLAIADLYETLITK